MSTKGVYLESYPSCIDLVPRRADKHATPGRAFIGLPRDALFLRTLACELIAESGAAESLELSTDAFTLTVGGADKRTVSGVAAALTALQKHCIRHGIDYRAALVASGAHMEALSCLPR